MNEDFFGQVDQAVRALDRLGDDVMSTCAEGLLAGGTLVADFCKNTHPYRDNTGALTRSWGAGVALQTPDMVEVVTGSDLEYAPWVELGHSMGKVPRWVPGKMVDRADGPIFQYQRGGDEGGIWVKAVEARPYPTLLPAVEAKKYDVIRLVALMLQTAVKKYDRGPAG